MAPELYGIWSHSCAWAVPVGVADDLDKPLKLLARSLFFIDPLDGRERHFVSQRSL